MYWLLRKYATELIDQSLLVILSVQGTWSDSTMQLYIYNIYNNIYIRPLTALFKPCLWVCSHGSLTHLLVDEDWATTLCPQAPCSPFLSLSYRWRDKSPVQSSSDDNIADPNCRQLSLIPNSCPKSLLTFHLPVHKGRCEKTASTKKLGLSRASQIRRAEATIFRIT